MIRIALLIASLYLSCSVYGQGNVFGPKGGLSIGLQSWSAAQNRPLLSYHGDIYIEGYREGAATTLFAQAGIHNRGSGRRVFITQSGSATSQVFNQSIVFTNASVLIGGKKRLSLGGDKIPYYSFGLRADYTVADNFADFEVYAGYLPVSGFISEFNYGVTLAAGYEFPFSEFVGGLIEVSVSPDLSYQYDQPQNIAITTNGAALTLQRQQVRNLSLELTVGLRFLHKVVYIDDF